MSRKIILLALLLAIGVGALSIRSRASRSGRDATTSLALLTEQQRILAAKIREAQSTLEAAKQTRAQFEHSQADPAASAGSRPSPSSISSQPPKSQSELISTDPKLEVLSLKSNRGVLGLEYGPFYRSLGLTSDQIKRFEEAHLKYGELAMDLGAVARTKDTAGKQTIAALQQKAKDEFEAEQRAALGDDGYQQLPEYIRTLVVRNVLVLNLAGAASLEGIPITSQQGEQLWQTGLRASTADSKGFGQDVLRAIDWEKLDREAQQILTPAQFTLFQQVAPPSGFSGRAQFQLEAAVLRAQRADAEAGFSLR